jgi:hypothetical protein
MRSLLEGRVKIKTNLQISTADFQSSPAFDSWEEGSALVQPLQHLLT